MKNRAPHRIAVAAGFCLAATLVAAPATASAAPANAANCQKDFLNDGDYPNHCLIIFGNGLHIDRINMSLNLGDARPVCATPEIRTISPDGRHTTTQPMAQVCGNAPLLVDDYQLVAGHDYPDGEVVGTNFEEYENVLPWTGITIRA